MAPRARVEQDRAGNRFGAGPFASRHDQQLGAVPHCVGRQNVGPVRREPAARPRRRGCSGRLRGTGEKDLVLLRDDGEERGAEGADGDRVHESAVQDAAAAGVRSLFRLFIYLFVWID